MRLSICLIKVGEVEEATRVLGRREFGIRNSTFEIPSVSVYRNGFPTIAQR